MFENLTKNNYSSCFEEPTLAFLNTLNQKHGLKVSLYCFFESSSGFNLSLATDKFKEEFKKNCHWLRFGFHAKDEKSKYDEYSAEVFISEAEDVYNNLIRIVSPDAITYDVRLGFAKGNKECIKAFKNKYPMFKNLYGVDDKRVEYYLTPEENDVLLEKGVFCDEEIGISIFLCERRLERLEDVPNYMANLAKRNCNVFFTHEVFFGDEEIKNRISKLCELADEFTF